MTHADTFARFAATHGPAKAERMMARLLGSKILAAHLRRTAR